MSIELLPPDPVYPTTYHVRSNWCNCHPETCCCNDWAVHAPNGDKHSTYRHEEIAEEISDLLNRSATTLARLAELERELEEAKRVTFDVRTLEEMNRLERENAELKQLWFSDADPRETLYAAEYAAFAKIKEAL